MTLIHHSLPEFPATASSVTKAEALALAASLHEYYDLFWLSTEDIYIILPYNEEYLPSDAPWIPVTRVKIDALREALNKAKPSNPPCKYCKGPTQSNGRNWRCTKCLRNTAKSGAPRGGVRVKKNSC